MAEVRTGRRIILADGTTFENAECSRTENSLRCYIPGSSMHDIYQSIFDREKMATIVYQHEEYEDMYTGYTEVRDMHLNDVFRQIDVGLKHSGGEG